MAIHATAISVTDIRLNALERHLWKDEPEMHDKLKSARDPKMKGLARHLCKRRNTKGREKGRLQKKLSYNISQASSIKHRQLEARVNHIWKKW